MTTSEKTQKKNDAEIMFPDVTICSILVTPWSFGKLFEFSSLLSTVLDKIEQNKEMLDEFLAETVSYFTYAKLFSLAGPEILEIIAMTVDREIEEIRALSIEDGIKITVTIFKQNQSTIISSLKNALSSPPQEEQKKEEDGEQEEK